MELNTEIHGLRVNPIEQDFVVHWDQKLGTGVNGPVRPCVERATGCKFALKCLLDSSRSRQEVHIHYAVNKSPHVVNLHYVYHNTCRLEGDATPRARLFLILELMKGGELFDRISQAEFFTEERAAHYMSQAVKAVLCLHEKNIAHRDLKPENLLLTDDSETAMLKLSDFGFAKVDDGTMKTPYFTPYYVAPQILEAQKHVRAQNDGLEASPYTYDKSCDMWSLGVILYIMLCGYPPFFSENPSRSFTSHMRRKIMAAEYEFPSEDWSHISNEAKDVIRRLLYVDPNERMTIHQLAKHPWLNLRLSSHYTTPLHSPMLLSDKSLLTNIKLAHAVENTQLRLADSFIMLKSMAVANNRIIRKRRHRSAFEDGTEEGSSKMFVAAADVENHENSNGDKNSLPVA